MPQGRIIVIGASTGGVAALSRVLADLPRDLGAPVLVVQHISPTSRSMLPEILRRAGPLPVVHPRDGAVLEPGTVYVAPPDRHMVVEPGRVRLALGPKENHTRPAVDALFRSAARAYGAWVVGVVLTGHLDNGTAGLAA